MNGELAQLICLASYGSVWLASGDSGHPPELEQESSTFRFVGTVEFAGPGDDATSTTVRDWLADLHSRGTRRLWLAIPDPAPRPASWGWVDEHMLVGFVNVGSWMLLATTGTDTDATAWRGQWSVGFPGAEDRRVWAVSYTGETSDAGTPTPRGVADASARLTEIVTRARDFAARHHLDRWVGTFQDALDGVATHESWPDMLSPGYPADAQRLARMASLAWVFGGMGSWNDEWVEGEEATREYEEISRLLYAATLDAFMASVDCELPPSIVSAPGTSAA